MWKIVYNCIIYLLFPFFALLGLTKKKVRTNFAERLYIRNSPAVDKAVWVHGASIGESVIAENLVRYMRSKTDFKKYIITTNTYYAADMLRKRADADIQVFSLPFDLPVSINRFMKQSTFQALILVETELWPNLLWAARKRNIPVIIVNGRLSDATIGHYRRFSFFLKDVLCSISLVLAQSAEHARRFASVGMDPSRVVETGNLKYYRFMERSRPSTKEKLITFGSIKERELPIVLPLVELLRKSHPQYSVYVVPRELTLTETIFEQLSKKMTVTRYSLSKDKVKSDEGAVVVVDTVGDLMSIYGRSELAFVGGSLAPYGGQNILEPLFFGTPVLFGPHIENFRDIGDAILDAGAGIMVQNGEELGQKIAVLLDDDALRERMGNGGLRMIEDQESVMARTASLITEVVWNHSRDS
ncbi:MAG: 3-deoxy-D-manno-octulosonic acid transferase [Deltaproteobacteria bacterium]|nr:3-deoxy-D-manno-octulosonic acid transferase [Deltaproteobacteria bacterium]